MSSNHKGPLAAFVVVAIACVVVLATNSMRSYARDAWSTFAAPVVHGISLIHGDRTDPTPAPHTPRASHATHAAVPAAGTVPVAVAAPSAKKHPGHAHHGHKNGHHGGTDHVTGPAPVVDTNVVDVTHAPAPGNAPAWPSNTAVTLPGTPPGWPRGQHVGWPTPPRPAGLGKQHAPGQAAKQASPGQGQARGSKASHPLASAQGHLMAMFAAKPVKAGPARAHGALSPGSAAAGRGHAAAKAAPGHGHARH